ncbi:MAG TPA: APC family permease [Gaiellales bacterium]
MLKTMHWWDGFVVGLCNPGFLLAGLAGSVDTLGPKWAAIIWFSSSIVGALQAYIYAEPATMFPDKSGGLSMYAKEGWRKYFSLAGPLATFGYWFAWSSVLAIYGGIIGTLLITRFWATDWIGTFVWHLGFFDVYGYRLIGLVCILMCFVFNVRGMRPAVWFSYVTGAMMLIPVLALAIVPFLNGDISNHALNQNFISASVSFYGGTPSTFQSLVMGIVWFWVIGWSSYGPEAPATFAPEFIDTKDDTRKALASAGILNCFLCLLLPLTIVAELGTGTIAKDTTYIAYLTSALDNTVGSTLGGLFVVFLSAGLLLSMNTATMDGSRALYGMAKEGLTVKQLDRLNHYHVPGRAMALDCILNICLLYFAPSLLFILVAGNIGYVLSHVFALSGVLLLRRDRPDWPRPFRLARYWVPVIWACLAVNLIATVFGVIWIKYTGYLIKGTDVTGYRTAAIAVGLAALAAGVLGYVIGQYQHGRKFSFKDPSDETPSAAAYELLGQPVPVVAGD